MPMTKKREALSSSRIANAILLIRGQKAMLDFDLAELYGVETKVLNQAVKRNIKRFPSDFMIQLTKVELGNWRSQFVTSNPNAKMGLRRRPFAFTEQGVAMLSSVLHSDRAIQVNIEIMRVFVRMREMLIAHKQLAHRIEQLEGKVGNHDEEIGAIFKVIKELMTQPASKKRRIGF